MTTNNINDKLSFAFTSAFGEGKIDTEDKYAFLIYIHLGVLRAAGLSIKRTRSMAMSLLNYVNKHSDVQNENIGDIRLLFENNLDTMMEIIEEIWSASTYNDELKWMEIWISNCKDFLKRSDFNKIFMQISRLAYSQIRLDDKTSSVKFLINSFIQVSKKIISNTKIVRIA